MKAKSWLHCDRVDREGDTEVSIAARMNSMTGGGGRRREKMIGQNPKAGSSALFVRGNRKKRISVFRTEVAVKGHADLMPKLRAKKRNRILDKKLTDAFPPNSTEHRSPVKENTQKKTVKKAK